MQRVLGRVGGQLALFLLSVTVAIRVSVVAGTARRTGASQLLLSPEGQYVPLKPIFPRKDTSHSIGDGFVGYPTGALAAEAVVARDKTAEARGGAGSVDRVEARQQPAHLLPDPQAQYSNEIQNAPASARDGTPPKPAGPEVGGIARFALPLGGIADALGDGFMDYAAVAPPSKSIPSPVSEDGGAWQSSPEGAGDVADEHLAASQTQFVATSPTGAFPEPWTPRSLPPNSQPWWGNLGGNSAAFCFL